MVNGSTLIVPGSHRWEPGRTAEEHEVVSAVMPAGSVLVCLGGMLHGAGPNTSEDSWRRGVFASYCLGWLRQEENLYIDVPPRIAHTLPEPVRELIGYKSHGALGFFDAEALGLDGTEGDATQADGQQVGDGAVINFGGRL